MLISSNLWLYKRLVTLSVVQSTQRQYFITIAILLVRVGLTQLKYGHISYLVVVLRLLVILLHCRLITIMRYQLQVILTCIFTLALIVWQEASSVAVVTRSTDESLRIHNNYIIHFKENATEKHLQRFVDTLVRRTDHKRNFVAEILQQFLSIKCLTARLSAKALSWVWNILHNDYV